jgi:hypothetical protein
MDLDIATENVAGGLLDLQLGGRLVEDIDPWEVASNLESRYRDLWNEITAIEESDSGELWRIEQRVRRLHDLGFDVGEMEITADEEGRQIRFVPRVVDSDYHQDRLYALTGLWAGQNQARRLLDDIRGFGAELQERSGRRPPENITAVRWLDQRFEPIIGAVPPSMLGKLQAAELYHQLLEHRWFLSERDQRDVSLDEALESYIPDVLAGAPDEQMRLDATGELFLGDLGSPSPG